MAKGGPQPGSGRPSNAARHEKQIEGFTAKAAKYLPKVYANLVDLAEGGTMPRRTWQAAGTIFRKDVVRRKTTDGTIGDPWLDEKGKPVAIQVPVYPHLPADQLVLVSEIQVPYAGDVRANETLLNRVAGTPLPAPATEADLLDLRTAISEATQAFEARRARLAKEAATIPAASPDDAPETEEADDSE